VTRKERATHVAVAQGIDHRSFRHWGGFIFSGLTAFGVDFLVIEFCNRVLGIDAFWSNAIGLSVATVVAWLLHRRISFNVPYPPSVAEFARFFVIAWAANGISLATNTVILWLVPAAPLEAAFLISRAVGGASSYMGFRFGVFHHFKDV
jgi:putative flippase GtrA